MTDKGTGNLLLWHNLLLIYVSCIQPSAPAIVRRRYSVRRIHDCAYARAMYAETLYIEQKFGPICGAKQGS